MRAARRYRTRDEISSIRTQRDPVEHVRKLLLDHELADSAELKKIEKARLFASSFFAVLYLCFCKQGTAGVLWDWVLSACSISSHLPFAPRLLRMATAPPCGRMLGCLAP